MALLTALHMASVFGILGNIVSFMVFLAPVPTFYKIYKKKSTQGFQAIPYSVALFSAMLLLYYAFLKKSNGLMIITINSIGCAIEATYLTLFIIYATKESKRLVIKTKSVEYMPFALSFFLTLCAVMWFFYGFLIHDYFIATPNILGFTFGVAQMVLYLIYNNKTQALPETKVLDLTIAMEMNVEFKEKQNGEDKAVLDLSAIILEIEELEEKQNGEDKGNKPNKPSELTV
ncbi:hypothetical protein RHMOL_Rhmol13G0021400 [Rhododendron molle]|uniref:Uncharacterized protein n=1 Tax=Rhododendron molle TaxID=49168 RepID=A0ACC0L2T5_RHOML|nr:hypothetical protein RHMOL_Rhmol13G0021400 [Rhododendron molle]